MARMNVVFEDSLLAEMRELVPLRLRSEFIEEAVRARLSLLKQLKAVEETAGAWSNEGREDPALEIRKTRQAWIGRVGEQYGLERVAATPRRRSR